MRITHTVGLSGTTVERLSERINEEIVNLTAEGLVVVDVRYAPLSGPADTGGSWDCYTALLLIGKA